MDSGDQWIVGCKLAVFSECKEHCRGVMSEGMKTRTVCIKSSHML